MLLPLTGAGGAADDPTATGNMLTGECAMREQSMPGAFESGDWVSGPTTASCVHCRHHEGPTLATPTWQPPGVRWNKMRVNPKEELPLSDLFS